MRRYVALIDSGQLEANSEIAAERLRGVVADPGNLDAAALLDRVGVTALVSDACSTSIGSGSVDLFISNNVFEHIPIDVITDILREFRRLASGGAVGSHYIDMGDHYCTFDSSISVYNYLRFPHWMWRFFNTDLQYQNRLRLPDYRIAHHHAGWHIVREQPKVGRVEDLKRIRVSRDFAHYAEQDLQIHASWILSRADPSEVL